MWKEELDLSFVGFMKDGAQWLVDNTDIKLVGKYRCHQIISSLWQLFAVIIKSSSP